MFSFQNYKIKTKLLLVIMLISVCAMIVSSSLYVMYQAKALKKQMVEELLTLSKILGDNTKAALLFDIEKDALDLLAALRNKPAVEAAGIYDESGQLFASYLRDDRVSKVFLKVPSQDLNRFEDDSLVIFSTISQKGNIIGSTYLRSDLKKLDLLLNRDISIAIAIIIATSVIIYLLSLVLQKVISDPILNLADTTKLISKNKDYSVRVKKQGMDETGILYDGFNEMLENIQEREKERDAAKEKLLKNEERFELSVKGIQ